MFKLVVLMIATMKAGLEEGITDNEGEDKDEEENEDRDKDVDKGRKCNTFCAVCNVALHVNHQNSF